MDGPVIRFRPAEWLLGGLLFWGAICTTSQVRAQRESPAQKGNADQARGQKSGAFEAGKTDRLGADAQRNAARRTAGGAARPGEPSAAYRESLRRTVERRRQRRARRQNAGDASQAAGAIVPWPLPPALIIRHTREVHGEVDSLLYGLRR